MKLPTVVVSVFVLALAAFAAQQSRVELRARLMAQTGRAKGNAQWKTRDENRRMEAELEVEGEKLAHNADFTVTIGSNAPFTVTSDAAGSFELEQRFNGTNRPVINNGDAVTVTDEANVVVLSGTFAPK